MLRGEIDQALKVRDGSVGKDTFGIVAGGVFGENGIGSGCEDKDVVCDYVAGRGLDGLVLGGNIDDSGVEVVVERPVWERAILDHDQFV